MAGFNKWDEEKKNEFKKFQKSQRDAREKKVRQKKEYWINRFKPNEKLKEAFVEFGAVLIGGVVLGLLIIIIMWMDANDVKIKPDKIILMPGKKGYKPAPVLDITNE